MAKAAGIGFRGGLQALPLVQEHEECGGSQEGFCPKGTGEKR